MAIFKKTDEHEHQHRQEKEDTVSIQKVEPAPAVRQKTVSVIGPTMEFKGELTADEDLLIEGLIVGTITHHKKHLTVGRKGRVKADVHASSVIVLGQLVGDIHSEGLVSLAKGADVTGNIFCGRISMEDGAKFRGRIEMGESQTDSVVLPQEKAPAKRAARPEKLRSVPKNPEKAS